jgi:superfamily II DNA or RNA helicase
MPVLLSDYLRTTTDPRFEEDWQRQRRTAADILQRLRFQEGVILADQVGMGKTYVALAVAVSQILSTQQLGQVVVFVPASVADKWVREWEKFRETLLAQDTGIRCVPEAIRSGEDLLKALAAPFKDRNHIVVLTHTALTSDVKDCFVQLALLYYATHHQRDVEVLRQRIAKWSDGWNGLVRDRRFNEERVNKLLATRPQDWRETWRCMPGCEDLGEEPVPQLLIDAIKPSNFEALREVLRALPANRSANVQSYIDSARRQLKKSMEAVWKRSLASIELDLPLLIVDEAHRLKNSHTQVSKLFAARSDDPGTGALANIFRRMLFLTATPFELGHFELVNILSRMGAVRALRPRPGEPLEHRLKTLEKVLTAAQASAITLDAAWGRLGANELSYFDAWRPGQPAPEGISAAAREAWEHAGLAVQARHEMHTALQPWVIRHTRKPRRKYLPGRAITSNESGPTGGLNIPEHAALPFLLAARAQSVALDEAGPARPLFAYGIASSYEAFGRLGCEKKEDGIDSDQNADDRDESDPSLREHLVGSDVVRWYRAEINRALRDDRIRAAHPKVRATVEKAAQLWFAGKKCLIFCWFIRSGEAIEHTLGNHIEKLIAERAAAAFQTRDTDSTREALDRISDRLFRSDSPSYKRTWERLSSALVGPAGGHEDVLKLVIDTAIRHMRTHGYLIRYAPLNPDLSDDEVWAGINGRNPGGIVLLDRWRLFAERLARARGQIQMGAKFEERDAEFTRISNALLGAHRDDDAVAGRGASLRTVRRASGQTNRHDRERLIALFNSPFAPDVLVASSVMGEGIDLHQECRYIIHHDLDWNPSVLEQRTGRLDRIGALAEREGRNIEVYEPYLSGTHDEKMFRVVKDRAEWFDIVMGRPSGSDESATDAEEARVQLHPRIKEALTMNLCSPMEESE